MIHNTLAKIEARIQSAGALKPETRDELISLVSDLKSEIATLSHTHGEEAQSIAGFTDLSTHEATRERRDPDLLKHSLAGLSASVNRFEDSHPKLVAVANAVCRTLANLGI
jgi:hypothetical protein